MTNAPECIDWRRPLSCIDSVVMVFYAQLAENRGAPFHSMYIYPSFGVNQLLQGVTKRCRLSLLTNSALVIRVQMRGEGRELGGLSQ
jgi:hypothetical protein